MTFLTKLQPQNINVSLKFLIGRKKIGNIFKDENDAFYKFYEENQKKPVGELFFIFYSRVENMLKRFFKDFYDSKDIKCLVNKGVYSKLMDFYIGNFDELLKDRLTEFVNMFGKNISATRTSRSPKIVSEGSDTIADTIAGDFSSNCKKEFE